MDVFDLSKNFPENSVEEILASHLFEHVNPYKAVDLLKSWLKILKPGGKLIMELPNIEELCKNFVNADKQGRYGVLNGIYGAVNTQDTEDNSKGVITSPHLWGWYPEMMQDHLIWAGFSNIIFGPEQIPHPYKNFRVEAVKPVIFRDAVENFIYDMVAPGDRVLDLGCGDKGRTKFLARNNEVISVDAWEKAKPDVLLDLEKESIPFPENSFDVVLMIDFIEHMSKTEGMRVISEAIKVCRKKVILFTPSFWTDNMENVNNPELWCYQNQYDSHKSLWALEDFAGWQPIPYPNKDCLLMMWNKK
jgi:predicted SAM-dependent methyltransferase